MGSSSNDPPIHQGRFLQTETGSRYLIEGFPPVHFRTHTARKTRQLGPTAQQYLPFRLYSSGDSAIGNHSSPLINSITGRPVKNDEMQGGRILRIEAYIQYAAMTKDEPQRHKSRLSTA